MQLGSTVPRCLVIGDARRQRPCNQIILIFPIRFYPILRFNLDKPKERMWGRIFVNQFCCPLNWEYYQLSNLMFPFHVVDGDDMRRCIGSKMNLDLGQCPTLNFALRQRICRKINELGIAPLGITPFETEKFPVVTITPSFPSGATYIQTECKIFILLSDKRIEAKAWHE